MSTTDSPIVARPSFGLTEAHARMLVRLGTVIPVAVPLLLGAWVVTARLQGWDVIESARRSAVTVMLVLAITITAPLLLPVDGSSRRRGFIVFWFLVSSFFNLTWQVPLILFRGTITTAAPTHDNLAKFVAWWGYGFADAHYGRVSRWMMSEELWWLMAIAMSIYGLVLLRAGREPRAFLFLGIAGALEAYNASLYMVYDVMTGLENVAAGSTTSLVLYWGFNPLWAGASLLASIYAFRFVLDRAEAASVA